MELNLKDEEEISYESQKQVAIRIMQTKLPEYVNSFVAAVGFDIQEGSADVDTTKKSGNLLQLVEDFINDEHPVDSKFTHGTIAASTFRFFPGHLQSVAKFVQQTKQQEEEKKILCQKRESVFFVQCQKGEKKKIKGNGSWQQQ